MTLLSDTRELLGSVDRLPYSIWQPLGVDVSPSESQRTFVADSDTPRADEREAIKIARQHLSNLLMSDADDRLTYLKQADPALTEDHLDQIVIATDRWLNDQARDRLRDLVKQRFYDYDSPANILIDWLTPQEIQRLIELLEQSEISDPTLALCYAICEALGVAHAAYFIHGDRIRREIDFTRIEQTPEEIAADLRFVNAQ